MEVPELMPMNILAWTSEEYHGERYMGPIAKLPLPEWNPSQPMPWSYIEQHRSTLFLGILGWMAPWFMVFGISKLEVPTNLAWFQFLMDLRFLQDGRRSRWLLFFPHTHKKHTFVKRSQTWKASPQSPSEAKKNTWFPPKHTNHGPMPSSWEELTHFWSWESTRWYKSWQLSLLDVFLWDLLNTRPRWIFPSLVGKIPNIFLKRRLYNDRWVPF